jgi:hypothetical protein
LCSSSDVTREIKSRRTRWAGHVARVGEMRSAYKITVGKPEGKMSLGRHKRRTEVKMDLREIGWEGLHVFMWLRIGTSGGLCNTIFVLLISHFHKWL